MRLTKFGVRAATMCFAISGAGLALGHEGHDHETASLLWPDHDMTDTVATSFAAVTSNTTSGLDHRITSWKLSDGSMGYSTQDTDTNAIVGSVLADVNTVAYDDDYVYIRTSGIPSHDIGTASDPNPAKAGDLDATYRISLNPTEETGEKTATGLSSIGIMVNGVSFYNQSDGTTWEAATNALTGQVGGGGPGGGGPGAEDTTSAWTTNALWSRADGLDEAGGHSSPEFGSTNPNGSILGLYHYHQTPYGLMEQIDPDNSGDMGSPIVGYAFDGYAVVGPFAYEEQSDGSLVAVQMTSSYGLEDNRGDDGPTIEDYELGSFLEDFVYFEGTGTLNEFNMAFIKFDEEGRAVLTDETDVEGDWAYFLTQDVIDAISGNDTDIDGSVAYPYIVGPEYFGVVDSELLSPDSVISIPDDVTYFFDYEVVPEPASIALLGASLLIMCRRRRAS